MDNIYRRETNGKYTFYDSNGRVIIITSNKEIGFNYVQSLSNMVK